MRKIILPITAIIIMVAVFACKTAETAVKTAFQEPVVSLHSVSTSDSNVINAQILCKIEVKNPNHFEIPFPQTDWELFIRDTSYKTGMVNTDGNIKARSTILIDVPIKIDYVEFFKTYKTLIGSKQTSYKTALSVKYSIPEIGEKTWNFNNAGEFPLPLLPTISAPFMSIESVDSSKVVILVAINVENPNVFAIPSPKFNYDYQLTRKSFIRGVIQDETPLPHSAVTTVKFRLIVNYADLFRSLPNIPLSRETPSMLYITCDFGIPIFSGEYVNLQIPGTFPTRR
jgi:LEA14-like dessication related protein